MQPSELAVSKALGLLEKLQCHLFGGVEGQSLV